jgi:hypothetical protein
LYLEILNNQLRYFTSARELVLTPEEPAIQKKNQVEAECQRVEMARQQAENAKALVKLEVEKNDRLRQKLREMGIDPDEIS